MHKLACPKCHESIVQEGNSYKCANNHCYDLAKTKYLNLLLNPDKATNSRWFTGSNTRISTFKGRQL